MNLVYRRMMLGVTLAVALVLAGGARAEGTNPVPYSENFEGYAADTALTNITGWSSPEGVIAFVTNTGDPGFTATSYPLSYDRLSTNMAVAFETGDKGLTNTFAPNTNSQVFYLDMMMKMNLEDQELSKFDADPSIHMALFADRTGSNYWVYNYDLDGTSNRLSVITNLTAQKDAWVRVTVSMDCNSDPFGVQLFQVQVNGEKALSPDGYQNPDTTGSKPGSWFAFANNNFPNYVSSVTLMGEGVLDDITLTTNPPSFGIVIVASTDPSDASRGSISPVGKVTLAEGENTNFVIVASNYFHIGQIRINGTPIGGVPDGLTSTNYLWDSGLGGSIKAVFSPTLAVHDVPHWWLAAQHPDWTNNFNFWSTNDFDTDADPTYIEYWTSSGPTNPNSVFEIVDFGQKNGTSYFTVVCASVDPALPQFDVQKSTNLMEGEVGWFPASPPKFGRVNGSNTWWESSASSVSPAHYRAIVTNVP